MQLGKQELIHFLSGEFDLDRAVLDENLPLFSSSLLDSTNMVSLVAFLEEQTGLVMESDDLTLDNFDTISSILTFCQARFS